jgi:1-acyl-sn-glycerol-3-phosphate acyltransferase
VLKKGVFVMAIRAAVPIVPISLSGSSKIMRKGKFAIRPGRLRITFHDPVPTKDCPMDERARIMESVRRAILAGLAPDELPRDAAPESPRLPTATRTATSG